MCGRFALHHSADEVAESFDVDQIAVGFEPRYNIAPSQPVNAILHQNARTLEALKWGLVPFWAKDPEIGNRMINARAETIAEKPSYRAALRRRRCVIPASGFFEWRKHGNTKIPTYIRRADDSLLGLAGLWEEWRSPDDEILHTCTIVTTAANEFMKPIHHRMPVVLTPESVGTWLDPLQEDPETLVPLLQPYAGDDLAARPVGKQVNAATYDAPDCIEPLNLLDL